MSGGWAVSLSDHESQSSSAVLARGSGAAACNGIGLELVTGTGQHDVALFVTLIVNCGAA
ncbi:MAG: hypothetical protein NNA18_09310 [Nitrospira sp.]|nr:hypothetical protein [Nitrospira sp.]